MTNERHEKALEAACRAMHECQGTGDADAPRFSPYQNSWDEPDTVRWTQWKETCEEVISAYLASIDAVICEATPKAFLVSDFADGAYLTRSLKAAEKSDHHFDALHPALPSHFTNGE